MKSSDALGKSASTVEITHISSHGVWLLARDPELDIDLTAEIIENPERFPLKVK